MDGTIWLDAHDNTGKNTKEMISTLACELKVCEQLLVMGYRFSNRIKLDEHKAHLEDRITSLEHQLGREMSFRIPFVGGHRG